MRAVVLFAAASSALTAFAACASSDELGPDESPTQDGGVVAPALDAAPSDDASDSVETDAAVSTCSKAGWCMTPLPDSDLMIKDVWPLPGRAFAIAESPTLGVKVLEWEMATDGWKYIDDGSQGEFGLGPYVGKMWAPSENEIYFTIAPAFVYRGTRPSPGAAWSWTRDRLVDFAAGPTHAAHDHGYPSSRLMNGNLSALGVWGVGRDDVYAWYSNAVFHLKSEDGGAPTWGVEYVAEGTEAFDEHLFILAVGGTSEAVWFAGARARGIDGCPILARKTVDGIVRIVDGVARNSAATPCLARDGALFLGTAPGWITDLHPLGDDAIVALKGRELVTLATSGSDYVVRSNAVTPVAMSGKPQGFYSFWWTSNEVWLSGYSQLVRGDTTDVDAGATGLATSTVSLTNIPLDVPLYRVRGTSETNLWAVGAGYALHKTTP